MNRSSEQVRNVILDEFQQGNNAVEATQYTPGVYWFVFMEDGLKYLEKVVLS